LRKRTALHPNSEIDAAFLRIAPQQKGKPLILFIDIEIN
jgi:hypothetical protein